MINRIAKSLLLALALLMLTERPAAAILTPDYTILGWTKDSSFFIYTMGYDSPEEWHAISALTAEDRTFTKKEDFDAFTKAHPLTDGDDVADGPKSPDGAVELQLDTSKRQSLKRSGKILNVESFPAAGTIKHAWSPDSLHIGFLFVKEDCAPSGGGDFNCSEDVRAVIDRTAGLRIKMVSKGLKPASLESAAKAVATAGFMINKREAAQAARPRSVVYAVKSQLEAARKLAAAVPGGAEVQPLTWDEKFDLVVALGATADH